MLLRLLLPLSDEVKNYRAIALHTIKRQPYGSCQLSITSRKHDHLIQQLISHHVLTISHHNMPCKNKLDVLYFVVASFTWLLRASSKNRSYLRIKPWYVSNVYIIFDCSMLLYYLFKCFICINMLFYIIFWTNLLT